MGISTIKLHMVWHNFFMPRVNRISIGGVVYHVINWLPLAFLVLILADMFFLHEYFLKTRHSVILTPAFAGLTVSFLVAFIFGTVTKAEKYGFRSIYRWYVALPLVILMTFLTIASMNT